MEFTEPLPFLEAIRLAQERGLAPTNLSSAQLHFWDDEIKRLSVFSARTNHAGYLQGIKDQVLALLRGEYNEATARAKLGDLIESLKYDPQRGGFPGLEDPNIPPAEPGSLRDLGSNRRQQLVLRTQMRQLANRGYRERGTRPAALFAFPAWELIRIYPRTVPRDDWPARWTAAGGILYGPEGARTRMIAEKSSSVWQQLGSRELFADAIGTDYPPFAFGSGMGWSQTSRGTCERLGVPISEAQKVKAAPAIDAARASVKEIDREFLLDLRKKLDVEISEGYARLKAAKG